MPPNQVGKENSDLSNGGGASNHQKTEPGSYFNGSVYNQFKEHIASLATIPDVRDKIKYILNNVENSPVEEKGKDTVHSQRFKEEADKALEKNDFKKALILYTEALRYTPHDRGNSKNITLSNIYSMRSLVLMKMNKLSSAVKDIDRALNFHPNKGDTELNERRQSLLILLKPILETVGRTIQPPNFPELYGGLSNELSSTSSALCMKESKEKGRHIVAVKDIPLGKQPKTYIIRFYYFFGIHLIDSRELS